MVYISEVVYLYRWYLEEVVVLGELVSDKYLLVHFDKSLNKDNNQEYNTSRYTNINEKYLFKYQLEKTFWSASFV